MGEAGIIEVGSRGINVIVYAMYSMKVTLWLRREQGYLSAQASTDRKAGRLSLPFYSIEFFDGNSSFDITNPHPLPLPPPMSAVSDSSWIKMEIIKFSGEEKP